jgi:hypothetical protein
VGWQRAIADTTAAEEGVVELVIKEGIVMFRGLARTVALVFATALVAVVGTVGTAVAATGTFYVNGKPALKDPSNNKCYQLTLKPEDYAENATDAWSHHYYDADCRFFAFEAPPEAEGTVGKNVRGVIFRA